MHQKLQFPFNLDSYRGHQPQEIQPMRFQNYFPLSQYLKEQSQLVPMSTDCATIQKQTRDRMAHFTLESLYEQGKINIYPKKNTVDLKNHLGKRMQKIEKKTEKAIVQIAISLLKKKENPK